MNSELEQRLWQEEITVEHESDRKISRNKIEGKALKKSSICFANTKIKLQMKEKRNGRSKKQLVILYILY